jgi:WD40 repeat protein
LLRHWKDHQDIVFALAVSSDGHFALSGGGSQFDTASNKFVPGKKDYRVRLYDLRSGKLVRSLQGHTNVVQAVAFSPDGRHAVTGSMDGTARVWDVASGRLLRQSDGHKLGVRALAVSPDGRYYLVGSAAGQLTLVPLPARVDDLLEAFQTGNAPRAAWAAADVDAMGMSAKAALPLLMDTLTGPRDDLRDHALMALGKIQPLLTKIADQDPAADIRAAAQAAIKRLKQGP